MATAAELWLLEDEGTVLGALAVGAAPGHVPAIDQPELYVQLLITRRSRRGEDLGGRLLALAEEAAREAGAAVTRVDCWAGSPGLIGWYESKGFVRCGTFEVNGWPGQLFTRRLG
jgi:GNAT superfamily N-acetyltransferase